MIRRLIGGAKRAFGLHRPGRSLDVFPDDIFLVSYPKSGNTWTRFLIANLMYPDRRVDFTTINQLTPDPEALSKRALNRLPRPRIIKSHQYFDPRFPRVIYIVRDPRDVALSSYHFDVKRQVIDENFPLEQYIPRFVRGESDHSYGSWGENVASWWYVRRDHPDFLLVRYESLQSEGVSELARMAEFLGIHPDSERLNLVLERCSADRMRELEKQQAHLWSSTRETRKDRPFVRSAKSGGWKAELPRGCVAEIESAWGGLMAELGYDTAVPALAGSQAALTPSGPGGLKIR